MGERSKGYFIGGNNGHFIVMQGFEMHSEWVADTGEYEGMETIVRAFNERDELLGALKRMVILWENREGVVASSDVALAREVIAKVESK